MTALKTVSKAKGSYLLVSVCSLILVGLVCLLAGWLIGSVRGQEFDVVSWDIRSFSYVRNPLTGSQITGIKHDNLRSGIDAKVLPYLIGGPLAPKSARWDLLLMTRAGSSSAGDPQILLDYLGAWGPGSDLFWSDWTTAHPTEAAVLWSAVRDVVHLSRYEKLPDLFDAARGHSNVAELKPLIAAIMVPLALEESRAALKSGDTSMSQAIAKQGLSYGASQELTELASGEKGVTSQVVEPSRAGAGQQ